MGEITNSRERRRRRVQRRLLQRGGVEHPPEPGMPAGTYWDALDKRYVAPTSKLWSLERYRIVIGDPSAERPIQPSDEEQVTDPSSSRSPSSDDASSISHSPPRGTATGTKRRSKKKAPSKQRAKKSSASRSKSTTRKSKARTKKRSNKTRSNKAKANK